MKPLNVKEVAKELGIDRSTVRRMILSGELPGFILRAGPRKKILRMRPEQLEKWIVAKEREQAASKAGRPRRRYETTAHTSTQEKAVIDTKVIEKSEVLENAG